MRRIITVTLVLGFLLVLALPASAAVEAGPKCADIDNLLGNYDGPDGDGDNADEFGIILKAPSCARFSYTIYVFNEPTDASPFFEFTWVGDGTTTVLGTLHQVTSAEDPDGDIYISAESFTTNKQGARKVFDRAPDSGFGLATVDGATPGGAVKQG